MKTSLIIGSCMLCFSCKYDKPAIPTPVVVQDTVVYWSTQIKPIIKKNCTTTGFCHQSFPNYTDLKASIDNGYFEECVLSDSAFMPPRGRFPEDTIQLLRKWIMQGSLKN